jgi:hypothetical protein
MIRLWVGKVPTRARAGAHAQGTRGNLRSSPHGQRFSIPPEKTETQFKQRPLRVLTEASQQADVPGLFWEPEATRLSCLRRGDSFRYLSFEGGEPWRP